MARDGIKDISTEKNHLKGKVRQKKVLKLGILKLKYDMIDVVSLVILSIPLIGYSLSPKAFLITTARYGKGSDKENKLVIKTLGENAEDRFNLYFQWYNVVHELGHGVIAYNSDKKFNHAEEEQLVNDFAVAYWRSYGEEEKLEQLKDIVEYAADSLDNPADANNDHLKYAKENWYKPGFMSFENYGWFQFSCVKASLYKEESLNDVLQRMGISNFNVENIKLLEYPIINEAVSTQIINDAAKNIRSWGLVFPTVYHRFSNNPNTNNSRQTRNIFGIFKFFFD